MAICQWDIEVGSSGVWESLGRIDASFPVLKRMSEINKKENLSCEGDLFHFFSTYFYLSSFPILVFILVWQIGWYDGRVQRIDIEDGWRS